MALWQIDTETRSSGVTMVCFLDFLMSSRTSFPLVAITFHISVSCHPFPSSAYLFPSVIHISCRSIVKTVLCMSRIFLYTFTWMYMPIRPLLYIFRSLTRTYCPSTKFEWKCFKHFQAASGGINASHAMNSLSSLRLSQAVSGRTCLGNDVINHRKKRRTPNNSAKMPPRTWCERVWTSSKVKSGFPKGTHIS